MSFALAITGRHLYVTIGEESLSGAVERHALAR